MTARLYRSYVLHVNTFFIEIIALTLIDDVSNKKRITASFFYEPQTTLLLCVFYTLTLSATLSLNFNKERLTEKELLIHAITATLKTKCMLL